MTDMQMYLLDINEKITDIWKQYFDGVSNIRVVNDSFEHFMNETQVECVVAPANSYGLMDGGYDRAISEWFGEDLMIKVQQYILDHYKGEQPIGSSFIIETGRNDIKLIHTPTMRIPSRIQNPIIIYQCMRTTLMLAIDNDIKSIVIPAFGGLCGGVPANTVCKMMWEGYRQIMNPPEKIDWDYANRYKLEE